MQLCFQLYLDHQLTFGPFNFNHPGTYVAKVPDDAMFTLCNILLHFGSLPTGTIKNVLTPVWPIKKNVTKHDVFNIRVKVCKLIPILKTTEGFQEFQELANANELLSGIDNNPSLNDVETYTHCH